MKRKKDPEVQRSNAESRVALIAGGVRGIGKALSLALAGRGWRIAACYRKNRDAAEALLSELGAGGRRALLVQSDVSKPENAATLVRRVESEYGRIDALIHCIGAYHRVPLMEESVEGWHEMFDHNLHPVFYLSRLAAAGMMQRRWGRIVSFSMVNADRQIGQPFVTAHYIAKMGVLALTRSLAKTLAPFGITANSISPGFIETGSVPKEVMAQSMKSIPAGYIGSPDDAVGAVCYLLSDDARYVNGTNIHLSGGWGI
ncbi:MAG: SDR family oxidoreductase [Acidobacteria bacterium]|nr:SDR family oxidoreductase [Acidobacteriota bacterium]